MSQQHFVRFICSICGKVQDMAGTTRSPIGWEFVEDGSKDVCDNCLNQTYEVSTQTGVQLPIIDLNFPIVP